MVFTHESDQIMTNKNKKIYLSAMRSVSSHAKCVCVIRSRREQEQGWRAKKPYSPKGKAIVNKDGYGQDQVKKKGGGIPNLKYGGEEDVEEQRPRNVWPRAGGTELPREGTKDEFYQ